MTTSGTGAEAAQKDETKTLVVPTAEDLKHELSLHVGASNELTKAAAPELEQKAEEVVGRLLSFEVDDEEGREASKAAVEQMGLELQKKAAKQSDMLQEPLKKLSQKSDEGGEVAGALVDLKVQVESLDPARFDFEAGWLTRLLGYLPFVGTPAKRYFSKYESAQSVIDAIIKSLELGREQLKRDNITLTEDQRRMREYIEKLNMAVQLAQLMDAKLQYRLEREIDAAHPKHRFVQEELLFPLRQRIMDLQQQLAVNQQGVLAIEIVIRNNKELIRGVNRALNVTINALQVAVTVALALENQRIVLNKVTALNQSTSNLIANTAERLKTQGAAIHVQAATANIEMETLKKAFADVNAALTEISEFRVKALPQMAQSILELDSLTKEAEAVIREKEQGRRQQPLIPIEIE